MQRTVNERVRAIEETVTNLQELPTQLASMKEQIDARFDRLETTFRAEIHDGDEEMRRFMRILYEDLVTRLAALGDRINPDRR